MMEIIKGWESVDEGAVEDKKACCNEERILKSHVCWCGLNRLSALEGAIKKQKGLL